MKNPKLITKPFAQNGQKNAIPENFSSSMESNQATWDTGFGQITMIPVAAGGLPPKGQDFNGIFNQISENIVYLSKGGRFKFSADYAAAINGYPKGAILQSDDEKKEYQSIIDNNKVNFNTATQAQINAAWKLISTDDMLQQIAGKQPAGNYALKGESYTKSESDTKFQPKGNYLPSGYSYSKSESDTKYQPKGNYAPAGDYATNTALNSGLNQKLNISGGRSTGAIFAPSFTVYYQGIKNIMNLYSPQTEGDLAYFQYSNDKGWLGRLEIPRLESGKGQLISTIDLEQGTNTPSITVYKDGSYYPMLRLKRSDGAAIHIEAKPDDQASLAQLYRRNAAGKIEYNLSFPKRTGTLAIDGDSYTKTESDSLIIGLNQKWVNVKSSRAKGATYTNTTGKPIMVAISVLLIGSGSGLSSTMAIDNVDFEFKGGGIDSSGGWKASVISMIIPANSKYKLESIGQIDSWVELRA